MTTENNPVADFVKTAIGLAIIASGLAFALAVAWLVPPSWRFGLDPWQIIAVGAAWESLTNAGSKIATIIVKGLLQ